MLNLSRTQVYYVRKIQSSSAILPYSSFFCHRLSCFFCHSTLCPFLLCLFNKHIIDPVSFVIIPSVIMSLCLFYKRILSLVSFVIIPSVLLSLCLFNKHILSSVSFVIMSSPIILSSVLLSLFANMNYFRYLCLQNKRKNKWQQ